MLSFRGMTQCRAPSSPACRHAFRGSRRSAMHRGTPGQNQAGHGGAGPACRGGRAGPGGKVVGLAARAVDKDQLRRRRPGRAHDRYVVRLPVTGALLDLLDFGLLSIAVAALARCRAPIAVVVPGALMTGGWGSNLLDRLGSHYLDRPGQCPRRGRLHPHWQVLLQPRGLLHYRVHAAIPAGSRMAWRPGSEAVGRGRDRAARARPGAGADPGAGRLGPDPGRRARSGELPWRERSSARRCARPQTCMSGRTARCLLAGSWPGLAAGERTEGPLRDRCGTCRDPCPQFGLVRSTRVRPFHPGGQPGAILSVVDVVGSVSHNSMTAPRQRSAVGVH